ncbi:MAG: porin family protein [Bacteroidales bacterium]|nr:porin family protein [Bacteroidales bacterium]
MKRSLFTLLLVFVIVGSTIAQQKAFQFGFKVAPSIGWIKPNSEGYKRDGLKMGFNWGFVGEFFLMENYAVTTGFNVIYVNGAYRYPDFQNIGGLNLLGETNRLLKLKYIQLPVVLKMKTNEFNGIKLFGEIGFGLGFNVGAKAEDDFYFNEKKQQSKSSDVSSVVRFTRESLILGAGIEYPLGGSTFLTAGVRFDNNFIDILKDQNSVDKSIEQKGISNFIELQLGLLF